MAVSCCPGFKWFNPNRSFPNVPHIFNTSLTSLLRKSPVGRLINTTWRSGPKACLRHKRPSRLALVTWKYTYLLVGNLWYSHRDHRGTKTCCVSKIETQPHGSSRSWTLKELKPFIQQASSCWKRYCMLPCLRFDIGWGQTDLAEKRGEHCAMLCRSQGCPKVKSRIVRIQNIWSRQDLMTQRSFSIEVCFLPRVLSLLLCQESGLDSSPRASC